MKRPNAMHRSDGFTLLEVILAIGILAAGLAMLGEAIRLAMLNGQAAKELTCAQMLAEGKMNELASGAASLSAISGASFDPPIPGWVYTVECVATDVPDVVSVRVTVEQDLPLQKQPFAYTLTRWMADPGVDLSAAIESQAAAEAAAASNSTTGSTTGSTGSTGSTSSSSTTKSTSSGTNGSTKK